MKIKYEYNLKSSDNLDLDGKCDKIRKEITLNANLSLKNRAITLGHELIHYLGFRASNFRASIIIDNILDYSNFLIEKNNLISIIKAKFGLRALHKRIVNNIRLYDYYVMVLPYELRKAILGFKLKNLPKNRLECSEALTSEPKTKKGKDMESQNEKKTESKLNSVSTASELSISKSQKIKSQENKKEVEKVKNEKKEAQKPQKKQIKTQKRQRKGKSLLTAYKINRMTPRLTLNLNRPCGYELFKKYT